MPTEYPAPRNPMEQEDLTAKIRREGYAPCEICGAMTRQRHLVQPTTKPPRVYSVPICQEHEETGPEVTAYIVKLLGLEHEHEGN